MTRVDTALMPILEDPVSRGLLSQIKRIAPTDQTVLITGTTGCGKEVMATLIHQYSQRKDGPWRVVHCGAIPKELFESTIFGHVRGAFSGAIADREGYLVQADGGTLFLDEIGELPLEQQAKLLRVLDGYSFRPVGGARDRVVDVRFVAATNRDLRAMVSGGRFREDLWARLKIFELHVPSLAERPMDAIALARHRAGVLRPEDTNFVERVAAAVARLNDEPDAWPLGVRELFALAVRADVLGVQEAELGLRSDWRQRENTSSLPAGSVLMTSARLRGDGEQDALAGLIRAKLGGQGSRGRPMVAAQPNTARALASVLLLGQSVSYPRLREVMGNIKQQTLENNLRPLRDVGLLLDTGEEVMLRWPPVEQWFQQEVDDEWLVIPPGAIPQARMTDRFRLLLHTLLPIFVRVFLVSHTKESHSARVLLGASSLTSNQRYQFEIQLDDVQGVEQLLVHVTWPNTRGVSMVHEDDAEVAMPVTHALYRARMALVRDVGPGWVSEYLIHHR